MYSLKYTGLWLASGYALGALIIVASLIPGLPGPETAGFDKLGHGVMYASLGAWFCGIYKPSRWVHLLIALVILGGSIEILQSLSAERSAEWLDMAANLAGSVVGLSIGWTLLADWCARIERRFGWQP